MTSSNENCSPPEMKSCLRPCSGGSCSKRYQPKEIWCPSSDAVLASKYTTHTYTIIPTFPHPSLYAGNFNCQRVNGGCNTTSPENKSLVSWAEVNNLQLLHDPKGVAIFFPHRWNVGTNSDLPFASVGHNNELPSRRVLGKLPRSQHRSSLITPPKLKIAAYSDVVNLWKVARLSGVAFAFFQVNPLRDCHLRHNKHRPGMPCSMREPVYWG